MSIIGWAPVATAAGDIKLAHSIFALPFALLGAILAWPGGEASVFAGQLALVVACMVCARTWAMLANRLADARFDADNPRTARRAIPQGRLSMRHGFALLIASGALFVGFTALFRLFYANVWPLVFSVPLLAWLAGYAFSKRFTVLCHLVLGTSLAASPVAAAVAVDGMNAFQGAHGDSGLAIVLIGAMVLFWVAGFDMIYALADIEVDRRQGLRSVPARLGWRGGAWASRGMHAAALVLLVLAWWSDPRLGAVFGVGVAIVGCVLVVEHAVLARRGARGLNVAFFTLNGVVSCVLGLAGAADVLVI